MSYLPVRLKTLKGGVVLGFDLYIKLPHKTLRYIRNDDDIDDDRISGLKNKKVRKLYINDTDEAKYQDYIDRCLNEVMNDDSVGIDDKASIVVAAGENTAERIYEDPHSKKSYDAAKCTTTNLISVLSANDELLKGIFDKTLDEESDSPDARMQKHAVNSSSLCISFAESLGLGKDQIEFLGVAGLFHDIAYGQMDESKKGLFFKEMKDMSAEELTAYKEHPKIGGEILQDKDYANKEIIELILIHEERRNGAGFPNKVAKLEPIQEILCMCCYYDQRVTCYGESRESVLEHMSVDQIGNFDLDMIKKFKSFVKKTGL
jgi:HD-GYP domain-containing protein (c-di-GMP phosphodiesterase class II)